MSEDFNVLATLKVEDYLNRVSYEVPADYVPSDFALQFVTFVKLVHGVQGPENKTPLMHYYMLDTLTRGGKRVVNLCHRGSAKTTVMAQYMILFIAVYGDLPGLPNIKYALYVSDSMENGVKKMRLRLEQMWDQSSFSESIYHSPSSRMSVGTSKMRTVNLCGNWSRRKDRGSGYSRT